MRKTGIFMFSGISSNNLLYVLSQWLCVSFVPNMRHDPDRNKILQGDFGEKSKEKEGCDMVLA
jgi:hypothetical protein